MLTQSFGFVQADAPTAKSEDNPTSRVLVVHSYHEAYEWCVSINDGLQWGFVDAPVELRYYYMDTKRKQKEEQIKGAARQALHLTRQWKPRIVIACDDNAQKYYAEAMAGKDDQPAIVFCGVNAPPEAYDYPASNVTGILERIHAVEGVRLLKRICPKVEKIAFITDDSKTSDYVIEYLKKLDLPAPIVSHHQPSTFEEWKKIVREKQKDVDALAFYLFYTVKDEEGDAVDPAKVMEWTITNNRLPSVGFGPENKALCSVSHVGQEHGQTAAQMAKQVMSGIAPENIPLKINHKGRVLFNLGIAEKLNVEIPYEILRLGQYEDDGEE
ncbi:MAG: ABC transporter substrate-binding protein [Candidatus Sumerlaeota bacterium]